MKITLTSAFALVALMVLAFPSSAAAAPFQAEFDALTQAIGLATFEGRGNDQANLLRKVANAEAKATDGKFSDAIAKIQDIQAKVLALRDADKAKISPADAQAILDAALTLINSILLPSE